MVDFALPEHVSLLVDTVRRFVETEIQPFEAEAEECRGIPPGLAAVREKAKALGLFAMAMPEEFGGAGLNHVESCLVEEQMGKTSGSLIRYVFGQTYQILLSCTAEQRERYLMPTVRGEKLCAIAITEPGAGSDAGNIKTTAIADGDDWVINGVKHFITDGDKADYIILMAVTDPEKRARGGITAFLIDKGTPGFRVARLQKMMGQRSSSQAELVFENCRVSGRQVIGAVGDGFGPILRSVSRVRLVTIGARSVGMATRLLEMARTYATQRVQFGQPIGNYQMIQQMIADTATELYAARMMVLNAAWEMDQGRDVHEKISMVKLFTSEMLGRAADRTLQIFGGMGYTADLPIERIYRDCRVVRIWEGTSEIHRERIARAIMRKGVALLD